jgi:hypothetical protein
MSTFTRTGTDAVPQEALVKYSEARIGPQNHKRLEL